MRRVVVTGGSGHTGRFVVADLVENGYDVLNVDVSGDGGVPHRSVDLLDYRATFEALDGYDAVAHLAANPVPDFDHGTGAARFAHNMTTTFNVFQAAVAHGMERVVWASSEKVWGFPFDTNRPDYLPIDHNSRLQPQNAYALAKVAAEEVARYLAVTSRTSFVALRMSNVLVDDPSREANYQAIPGYWSDPFSRKFNLWGYVDARDVASAVRLALVGDLAGAHELAVAAADTIMDVPNRDLVEAVFPDVPIADGTGDYGTLISIDRTREVLGWSPRYGWRSVLGAR